MTDTRHALLLALAMGAVGLAQGQGGNASLDRCRAGTGQASAADASLRPAARHKTEHTTDRCAGHVPVITRTAAKR